MLALPFLFFYWLTPFVSDQTLGSDYINYHIYHQLDLLFSVKTGAFPLFAPACYYGQSSAYPHAQLYHPLGYLASLMPGFWQGYSLEWLTLFRLIILALCHFCLYQFLARLPLSRFMAFIISLITVYNLRMLDLFWNVIALEAYTGTLLLCSAIGCYFLKTTRRQGPLLIIGAAYWLLTSGFAPMVFFGAIGSVLFTMLLPFLYNAMVADAEKKPVSKIVSFWGRTGLFLTAGILLSSDYLWPFFWDYMKNSSGRIDQPYLWSTQWTDTLPGFFNNFFWPLGAGFSMFGGSPLFLAAVVAPFVLTLFRVRVPAVIWIILGIIILCSLYMQGNRTPVHPWVWQHVPLASTLRGPVRIALMLPLLFMMTLAWAAGSGHGPHPPVSAKSPKPHPMTRAAMAALVITVVYISLPDSLFVNPHYSCPYNLRPIPGWFEPAFLAASLIALLLVFLYFSAFDHRKVSGFFLAAVTICQLTILFRYGAYSIADKEKTPTCDQILAQKKEAINFQPVFFLNQHAGSRVVDEQLKNYFMEPRLASLYRRYDSVADTETAYTRLNSDRKPDEVMVENFTAGPEVVDPGNCLNTSDRVTLTYSSYNRLIFSAQACRESFFVLSYPFSGRWRSWLDGNRATIYRANGAAQAVLIPPGEHTIEFRYWSSAAFYGMMTSCLTFALVIGLAGIKAAGVRRGMGVAAAALVCAAGLFGIWYTSLYAGDNLGTRYEWQSPAPGTPVNLAFGKPTQMSSHAPGYPYLYNSRHAVDGGRGVDSCFFTDKEGNPWWRVDLRQPETVGKIVLYTGFSGPRFNGPPLIVSISDDGERWRKARVERAGDGGPMEIVFSPPETLRHITIQASGECILSLNEVEVYRPDV